ncbi:MAG: VOC family protein [Cyanobacteria bacterium J06633_23]
MPLRLLENLDGKPSADVYSFADGATAPPELELGWRCPWFCSAPTNTPMIQRTLYVLAVLNLETSANFYRDVLGFTIEDIGDPGWRMYVRDGCRIMAGECPDAIPPQNLGDHSYFAYFVVDDVDTEYDNVIAHDVEIIKPLRDEPWGMREFGLRTVDGHRIMIGKDLDE